MWKDVEPFVGLLMLSSFLVHCNSAIPKFARAMNKATKTQVWKVCLIALTALAVSAILLIVLNVPASLERTHPDVVAQKAHARSQCESSMEKFDFGKAEQAIRNLTLSKELHKRYSASHSQTVAHRVGPLFNYLLFRTGALCPLIPLFVILVFHIASKQNKSVADFTKSLNLPSDADWSLVFLPALNMVTVYCWIVNLAFHFYLREQQVSSCMLLSGHWYTFAHTLACFALSGVFFWCDSDLSKAGRSSRVWTSSNTYVYYFGGWFTVYVAFALNVLRNSQMFHHDPPESNNGLKCFAFVMPFAAVFGMLILRKSLEASQSKAGKAQGPLAEGAICEVIVDHDQTDDGSESVSVGDLVRVLADQDGAGWVEVTIASNKRKVLLSGFVPAYCLLPVPIPDTPDSPSVNQSDEAPLSPASASIGAGAEGVTETEKEPAGSSSSESEFLVYEKMRKAGLPERAIKQKMQSAAVSDAAIDRFFGGGAGSAPAQKSASSAPAPIGSAPTSKPKPRGLLDAIQGGAKLKKAPPPAAKAPTPPTNPLLAALQGDAAKKRLKKAKAPAKPPPKEPAGLKGALSAALNKRRTFLDMQNKNQENDDDDDDDGDDDDW